MKLRLLLGIVFFVLVSCSGDNASETVNTNEPVTETPTDSVPSRQDTVKVLKEIKRHNSNVELVEFLKYENGRQTDRLLYNNNGQNLFLKDISTFDSQGRMIKNKKELTDGSGSGEKTISFDSQGRISLISMVSTGVNFTSEETFTYIDNYIVGDEVKTTDAGEVSYKETLYEINAAGYIYKVTETTENYVVITTATYDAGNRLQTLTTSGNNINGGGIDPRVSTYVYDLNTEVKTGTQSLFGNYKYNYALYNQTVTSENDRYVIKLTDNNYVHDYSYEFDAAGYPAIRRYYDNEGLYIEDRMTYYVQ